MALEHGGVAPVILDESADIDFLVPKIAKGGFIIQVKFVFCTAGFLLGKQKPKLYQNSANTRII